VIVVTYYDAIYLHCINSAQYIFLFCVQKIVFFVVFVLSLLLFRVC